MKKCLIVAFMFIFVLSASLYPNQVEEGLKKALNQYKKGDIPQTIQTLAKVVMHLQNGFKLNIKNLNLCYSIEGFGVYKPIGSFILKKGQPLLLYFELEGFSITQDSKNRYWINITEDMKIEDAKGKVMFDKKNFLTYNKYFMVPIIPFNIKNTVTAIPVGKYKFYFTIKDHNKNATISRQFEFEVK